MKLIDYFIKLMRLNNLEIFAFVPPDSYHVTLVNRSHFGTDTKVKGMTKEEKEFTGKVIIKKDEGPIEVQFKGLILTTEGHLLTPLSEREVEVLLLRVAHYGKYINRNLSFADVYTPVGRIFLPRQQL